LVNGNRVGKLLAGLMTVGLLVTALAPSAIAAPPRWAMTVTQLVSGGVTAGSAQGFDIVISNRGPSNISSLYLVDSVPDGTVYLDSSRAGCDPAGSELFCTFGALNAGASISVRVAYLVPFASSGGNVTFEINSTGIVPGKNNSHGDALDVSQSVTVLPAGTGDKAGQWVITPGYTLANNQAVSNANPQATRVAGIGQYIPVSLEDGSGVSFQCPKSSCKDRLFGQWSRVSVAGGASFGTAFEVTITVAESALPGGTNPDKVVVYHVLDDGTIQKISTACTTTPPTGSAPECRSASFDGAGNLVISVWVYRNGGFKGAL
jgi:uncharacterized repeat protein (TIGR01451 family)